MTRVSAVIVNYNAGSHLSACLAALARGLEGVEWEGVVVDNASTDGSWRAAQPFAPAVSLIHNRANVGFARAANQGVAATSSPIILFINPDCRAEPGFFRVLAAELDAHPGCAIVGPRVLDPDGAVQGSARGDPTIFTGLFGRTSLFARLFPGAAIVRDNIRTEAAIRSRQPSAPVDWLSGACMLARRVALEAVGGFDEGYFLYWEDADLCRRLRAAGREIRYVPGANVVHVVGQSSRTVRGLAIREFHRSAYRYYTTHVARGPLQRWFAKTVLMVRCWSRLLAVKSRT